MKPFFHKYALGIVLLILFLACWSMQAVFQVAVLDKDWAEFGFETFTNWQAGFFVMLIFLIVSKKWIFEGSVESRDTEDEILRRVKELEKRGRGQT